MASFTNPKRRLGTSLMVLGFVALVISHSFHAFRSWFSGIYFVAFSAGLILNLIGWKEEKREQHSP